MSPDYAPAREMTSICRVLFFALLLLGIVGGTTTTTARPPNDQDTEEAVPFLEDQMVGAADDMDQFRDWGDRQVPPMRHYNRRRYLRLDGDGNVEREDPVRVRRRQRAQFLMLVALVQVWIAFLRLINRNRQ